MPRPHKCRFVGLDPTVTVFKPRGVPSGELTAVELPRDELEAIRLADLEGLYQDEAAERMGVSRATLGRLVRSGRAKVADALVNGKMISFKGGVIAMTTERRFECEVCGEAFEVPQGTGRPAACPACGSGRFHRTDDAPGRGARGPGRGGMGVSGGEEEEGGGSRPAAGVATAPAERPGSPPWKRRNRENCRGLG